MWIEAHFPMKKSTKQKGLEKLRKVKDTPNASLNDYVVKKLKMYDEVDEEDYELIMAGRARCEKSFIVDDDGEYTSNADLDMDIGISKDDQHSVADVFPRQKKTRIGPVVQARLQTEKLTLTPSIANVNAHLQTTKNDFSVIIPSLGKPPRKAIPSILQKDQSIQNEKNQDEHIYTKSHIKVSIPEKTFHNTPKPVAKLAKLPWMTRSSKLSSQNPDKSEFENNRTNSHTQGKDSEEKSENKKEGKNQENEKEKGENDMGIPQDLDWSIELDENDLNEMNLDPSTSPIPDIEYADDDFAHLQYVLNSADYFKHVESNGDNNRFNGPTFGSNEKNNGKARNTNAHVPKNPEINAIIESPAFVSRAANGMAPVLPYKVRLAAMGINIRNRDGDVKIENNMCRFYWIDLVEFSMNGYTGLLLLGKTRSITGHLISTCLMVKKVVREIYMLPKTSGHGQAALEEVRNVMSRISDKNYTAELVKRKNVFATDPSMCGENEYVYLRATKTQGLDAISWLNIRKTFGLGATSTESFLLERSIRGPQWLDVKNVRQDHHGMSWCQAELVIDSSMDVSPIVNENTNMSTNTTNDKVSISMVTLNILSGISSRHPNEIYMVSMQYYPDSDVVNAARNSDGVNGNPYNIPASSKPVTIIFLRSDDFHKAPEERQLYDRTVDQSVTCGVDNCLLELCSSEKVLLNYVAELIENFDPDVLCGHQLSTHMLPILLDRMITNNADKWSALGRVVSLARSAGASAFSVKTLIKGRLICDTFLQAQQIIKGKEFTIEEIFQSRLAHNIPDNKIDFDLLRFIDTIQIGFVYEIGVSTKLLKKILQAISLKLSLQVMIAAELRMLDLSKHLTTISGNVWSGTLLSGISERSEYLLLHHFRASNFILPEKIDKWAALKSNLAAIKPSKYIGGLVLEPKIGFHDKYTMLVDFNSLYPSIIREFNICHSTVDRNLDDILARVPNKHIKNGVLPQVLASLTTQRTMVKKQMANETSPEVVQQLNVLQQAIKLSSNSIYGCLGFKDARFYAPEIAELVTALGRSILTESSQLAKQFDTPFDVIYGDTDSLMLHITTQDIEMARKQAALFCAKVNSKYNHLELEVEAVYEKILLSKKKRYASLEVLSSTSTNTNDDQNKKIQVKGLDLVRRDWCPISADISMKILQLILYSSDIWEHDVLNYLQQTLANVRAATIPWEKFVIRKGLNKHLDRYANAAGLLHVQVGRELVSAGHDIQVGDIIPYVVCKGGKPVWANIDPTNRPKPDYEWYIHNQISPPIRRLLMVIDTYDKNQLDSMFEDPSKVVLHTEENGKGKADGPANKRFGNCGVPIMCDICGKEYRVTRLILIMPDNSIQSGISCKHCGKTPVKKHIIMSVIQHIRDLIANVYKGWKCSEPDCIYSQGTLQVKLSGPGDCPCINDCNGNMIPVVDPSSFYDQLISISDMFTYVSTDSYGDMIDLSKANNEKNITYGILAKKMADDYAPCKDYAELAIRSFAYGMVDLPRLYPTRA